MKIINIIKHLFTHVWLYWTDTEKEAPMRTCQVCGQKEEIHFIGFHEHIWIKEGYIK